MHLKGQNTAYLVISYTSQLYILELGAWDLGKIFLLRPDAATSDERLVGKSSHWREMVMLGEEGA